MTGRILCRLGLHRWEFIDRTEHATDRLVIVTTYARCRRPLCSRMFWWSAVNVDMVTIPEPAAGGSNQREKEPSDV